MINEPKPARAIVQNDFASFGVRIGLMNSNHQVYVWENHIPTLRNIEEGHYESNDEWLRLDEQTSRALYEALTEYYGHSSNDVKALRRDYEAERKRVDNLIEYATNSRKL